MRLSQLANPVSFYDGPWWTRLFLWARWRWVPYAEIGQRLPQTGRVLDVGCGHGLFAYILSRQGAQREVMGVDHDSGRIEMANKAFSEFANLSFGLGGFEKVERGGFVAVTAIDVMHYLSTIDQVKTFHSLYKHLPSGGSFLFRDVNIEVGFLSFLARCHEKIMTGLKFTKGENLNFHTIHEWEAMVREAGFLVESFDCSRFPFVDRLYVCRKP